MAFAAPRARDLAGTANQAQFVLSARQQAIAEKHKATLGATPTPQQVEMFKLDPLGFDRTDGIFSTLPRPAAEYFRKLYNKQLKKHVIYANNGFAGAYAAVKTAQQYANDVLFPRLDRVLSQYTHITALTDPNRVMFFVDTMQRPQGENAFIRRSRKPLYLYTKNEIDKLFALPLAGLFAQFAQEFADTYAGTVEDSDEQMHAHFLILYKRIATRCAKLYLPLPNWAKYERGKINLIQMQADMAKACDAKYWNARLNKIKKHLAEHIAIAAGQVNKHSSPYASAHAIAEDERAHRKAFDFLKNQIVMNIDDPEEQFELYKAYLGSPANPAVRRAELMNMLRGAEEWSESRGDVPVFLTLTAPSRYHAYKHSGAFNDKWQGAAPKQTQAYLCKQWAKMRSAWKRNGIYFYGMRVTEPHHDATPHWHLMCYVRPEQEEEFIEIFRRYALEVDSDEPGARKHRCKVEKYDPKRGTPTAYITKYISKNINGYALDGEKDDETGKDLKEIAQHVTVWAKLWRLRQFQFFGLPPLSVWREVRRLTNKPITADDRLDKLRAVADIGEFACYIREQGGTNLPRKDMLARLSYQDNGTNCYGEEKQKIQGIYNQIKFNLTKIKDTVKTRLKNWTLARKPEGWQPDNVAANAATQTGDDSRTWTWTCGNNCTPRHTGIPAPVTDEARECIKNQLILMRGRVTEYQIDELLAGKPLKIYSTEQVKVVARYVDGQLIQQKEYLQ